jgi:SAM-dependent methyltransferase
MAEQNAYQVADWNRQSGEHWVANQARLEAMLEVFGQAAIDAAAPATGERVLDVGCGAGGQVLGVDTSEPLIGRARGLAPQDSPALFRVDDARCAGVDPRSARPAARAGAPRRPAFSARGYSSSTDAR